MTLKGATIVKTGVDRIRDCHTFALPGEPVKSCQGGWKAESRASFGELLGLDPAYDTKLHHIARLGGSRFVEGFEEVFDAIIVFINQTRQFQEIVSVDDPFIE
jgi:hypothetical protein